MVNFPLLPWLVQSVKGASKASLFPRPRFPEEPTGRSSWQSPWPYLSWPSLSPWESSWYNSTTSRHTWATMGPQRGSIANTFCCHSQITSSLVEKAWGDSARCGHGLWGGLPRPPSGQESLHQRRMHPSCKRDHSEHGPEVYYTIQAKQFLHGFLGK